MGGDVAPRLADPVAGARCAGQAHGFGQRLVDVARRQPLQRAVVARVGVGRRAASARWTSTSEPSSRRKLVHQLSCGPPRRSSGPSALIFGDQVVEPHRLVRGGDDRRDRRLVLRRRSGRPAGSRDSRARLRDRSRAARRRRRPARRRGRRNLPRAGSHSRPARRAASSVGDLGARVGLRRRCARLAAERSRPVAGPHAACGAGGAIPRKRAAGW